MSDQWEQILGLLQQLEVLLQQQAQALVVRNVDDIARLSALSAGLCLRLKALSPFANSANSADIQQLYVDCPEVFSLARVCQKLHRDNSNSLARLSACCQKLTENSRGAPLCYGNLSRVVHRAGIRSLFRI